MICSIHPFLVMLCFLGTWTKKLKSCVSQWLRSKGWHAKSFIQNSSLLCFVGILFTPVPSNYLHRLRLTHTTSFVALCGEIFLLGDVNGKEPGNLLEMMKSSDTLLDFRGQKKWSDGLDTLWKLNWVKISNDLGVISTAGMLYLPNLLAMFSISFHRIQQQIT